MLSSLRLNSALEKAVLVSNFTSSLDQVQILAEERGWGTLRIDGDSFCIHAYVSSLTSITVISTLFTCEISVLLANCDRMTMINKHKIKTMMLKDEDLTVHTTSHTPYLTHTHVRTSTRLCSHGQETKPCRQFQQDLGPSIPVLAIF